MNVLSLRCFILSCWRWYFVTACSLPTIDEFLDETTLLPSNSYINHPDFASLYVRKGKIGVRIDGDDTFYWCNKCVTIANITARNTGQGAFTALVADLVDKGFAIYVENANSPRFRIGLMKKGWTQVNCSSGFMFLRNYDGHLEPV